MKSLRFATLLGSLSIFSLALLSCQKEPSVPALTPTCVTPAVVRDLSSTTGCGNVLELKDGTRLQPVGSLWQNFKPTNGLGVYIDYKLSTETSACSVGNVVELTCIRASGSNNGTIPMGN